LFFTVLGIGDAQCGGCLEVFADGFGLGSQRFGPDKETASTSIGRVSRPCETRQ
jgi:hypothetical protein